MLGSSNQLSRNNVAQPGPTQARCTQGTGSERKRSEGRPQEKTFDFRCEMLRVSHKLQSIGVVKFQYLLGFGFCERWDDWVTMFDWATLSRRDVQLFNIGNTWKHIETHIYTWCSQLKPPFIQDFPVSDVRVNGLASSWTNRTKRVMSCRCLDFEATWCQRAHPRGLCGEAIKTSKGPQFGWIMGISAPFWDSF